MVPPEQFLKYCREVLQPHGLGVLAIYPPARAGGGEGQSKIHAGYLVPISLGGVLPGVLSTVVVEGRIPWLLPVGLMKALKARLDLD